MIEKTNRKYTNVMVQSKEIPEEIITDVAAFSKVTEKQIFLEFSEIKYNMEN